MKVYLDTNVISDCLYGRDQAVKEKVSSLLLDGIVFPFSPAHMEEIAVIYREAEEEKTHLYVQDHISFISRLSGNCGLMPSEREGVVLRQEHPQVCMDRVLDQCDATYFAESNEEFLQSGRDQKSYQAHMESLGAGNLGTAVAPFEALRKHYDIDKKVIGNIRPERIFDDPSVKCALEGERRLSNLNDEELKYQSVINMHAKIERYVDFLLRFLEKVGFRPEPAGRHRSRMHDVSHAIYATAVDVFVIGDAKFRDKAKAVYHYLEVPVTIMSKEEFVGMQG